ncbi:DUF4845 domain-containing protein [Aquipseudomonas alcaligenes]|uniref:DUF4845 domain-containing protein n=1 Tax=Aquipseudomonas alcaligenes TaxID=43263 RepID=A0A2V4L1Z6_AQUAC|nr:DUF4845 domain-containing protein [Pseudomonas alcaligenes]PYC25918.1 DUF4845 domain-containing protein [Pseudomonas alcaligenes]
MMVTHSQKGMSLLGWLMVLALVAFFASTAFKMLPHYMDYMAMEKMITEVEKDPSLEISTVNAFYEHMQKGMQVNNIRDINLKEAVTIKLEDRDFQVHLSYEKREPLIQNLDLVARFDKEFRVRAQ